jgi:hypothetical protein
MSSHILGIPHVPHIPQYKHGSDRITYMMWEHCFCIYLLPLKLIVIPSRGIQPPNLLPLKFVIIPSRDI